VLAPRNEIAFQDPTVRGASAEGCRVWDEVRSTGTSGAGINPTI